MAWTSNDGGGATTITSVTDNTGNVYVEVPGAKAVDSGGNTMTDLWYATNSLAGATVLTITPNPTGTAGTAVVWQFSGVATTAPLDRTAVLNSQAATTTPSGAPVTTAFAAEAVISVANVQGTITGIVSGNSFTNDSTANGNGWAHLITSSAGTYQAQWANGASGTYASSTASFKAASSAPSFTVSATPASQTVTPGTNAAYTVSVTPSGGFTGTVSLSASGLPMSATASFNPTSITTSGTSTLTVSTASSTPAASYPLTITGTSGSLSQTATATLVVSSSGTYSACDVNKDGSINVVDVQIAVNNYMSCPTTNFQTFEPEVMTGIFNSCPVTSGFHTVSLNWTASTTSGVTYNVYRATSSGGYNYSAPLATGISATSYTDCSVTLGQAYYYVTRAVSGSTTSVNSNEMSVTIPAT
ncbi:MAG: hypothetical protein ACLQOO_30510 [Terriglobia bacterium]